MGASTAASQYPAVPLEFSLAMKVHAAWTPGPAQGERQRDLKLGASSRGLMQARHVAVDQALRSVSLAEPVARDSGFGLFYLLKGSAVFRTPAGETLALAPGDCIHQPGLRTRNTVDLAAGSEYMEMSIPESEALRALYPEGLVTAGWRDRPYLDRDRPEAYVAGNGPRKFFSYRDLGIAETTARGIHIHVVKVVADAPGGTGWHYHTMSQIFLILSGWADLAVKGHGTTRMAADDAMCIGAGTDHNVPDLSRDYALIEVCMPADYDTVPPSPES